MSAANSAKEAWEKELTAMGEARQHGGDMNTMTPRQALRELEEAMPEGAIVSTDIGNICSVSNSYLRFDRGPRC